MESMAAPIKRRLSTRTPKRKATKIVKHKCLKEALLENLLKNSNKLSIIITGNGDASKGLDMRLAIVHERQQGVLKTLDGINEQLRGVNENHNVLLTEITNVGKELVGFKSELIGEKAQKEKDKKDEKERQDREILVQELKLTKKRDRNWKIATITSIILTAIGLAYGIIRLVQGQATIKSEVLDKSVPVVVNPRGQIGPLPSGYKLKMFPRDFIKKDSVKKDSIK